MLVRLLHRSRAAVHLSPATGARHGEASRLRPRGTAADQALWRVRLRSAQPLAFALLGQWDERIRIVRWKWLAKIVAYRHDHAAGRRLLTGSIVEPYVSGSNVVALKRPGSRGAGSEDRGSDRKDPS